MSDDVRHDSHCQSLDPLVLGQQEEYRCNCGANTEEPDREPDGSPCWHKDCQCCTGWAHRLRELQTVERFYCPACEAVIERTGVGTPPPAEPVAVVKVKNYGEASVPVAFFGEPLPVLPNGRYALHPLPEEKP